MKISSGAAAVICGLTLASAAFAADVTVKSLGPGEAPAPATLADFKGLLGDWAGPLGTAGFSAPSGGQIVGHLALLTDPSTPRVEEIWILRPEGASVLVQQKHYTPDLKDREDKDTWGKRRLVGLDSGHIYLENLTWVTRGRSLDLVVRVPAPAGAPPTLLSFTFDRVK